MTNLILYNQEGKESGKIPLPEDLWNGEIHSHVLHLALKQELANRRAGTHDVKNRSEVSGSGKKPWKQKGTGRARSGSVRSPLWRHGGVIFGPTPRDHGFSLPKAVRKLALRSALRNLAASGKLAALETLSIPEAKTKHLAKLFRNLKTDKTLVLCDKIDENIKRAGGNLSKTKFLSVKRLNVHDLLRFKKVFILRDSLKALEEALA